MEYYWHLARKTCYQKHTITPQQPLKNKITVNGVVEIILLATYKHCACLILLNRPLKPTLFKQQIWDVISLAPV